MALMAVSLALRGAHMLLMQYIVCVCTETVEWLFGTCLRKKGPALSNDAGRVNFPERKRATNNLSKHPTEKDPKIGACLIS